MSNRWPNTNYDVYSESGLGYLDKVGYHPDAGRNKAYAFYDLSHVAGKQIIDAKWHGFWVHSYLHDTKTRFRLHPVNCGWNKSTITWNNRPCIRDAQYKDAQGKEATWSHVDITDWVKKYASGSWANHGLMVDTAGDGVNSWKKLGAAERGPDNGASVVTVDFNDWPAKPSRQGCSGDGCTLHSGSRQLGVNIVDGNNDPMTVQFYVSTSSDVMESHFTSHQVDVNAGSTSATWTVPSLQWDETYYWRVRIRDPYMPDNTWRYSDVWSFRTTNTTPPVPALDAPADRAVVIDKQPTLTADAVTDPDGDAVQYQFSLATGADGRSGQVARSGWLDSPSWQVPAGVLKDGVSDTWTVRARDKEPGTESLYAPARKLKLDLRLGLQDAVPGDETGPVKVNLSTGNLLTTASGPSMHTVGGDVSLDLTYNSQSVDETGLVGEYFTGDSTSGIDDDETPVLVRTDAQLSFDWARSSPYAPVIAKDGFRARWKGYLRVPEDGDYVFGGYHDDGMRVWIGGDKVYDRWNSWTSPSDPPDFTDATTKTLQAGQTYSIRVEYREGANLAQVELWARKGTGDGVPVPASWLSPTAPVLPPGWSMSVGSDASGANYTKATLTENSVVLTDANGASHSYTKLSDGGYAPPPGEHGILSRDANGKLTLIDDDGTTFAFTSAGGLASITAPIDARKPAATQLQWSSLNAGNVVPRLTKVTDPVSGRAMALHYSSGDLDTLDPACERDPWQAYAWPAPAGFLCGVTMPDGSSSQYYYSNGRIGAIEYPGNQWIQYAFNGQHLLDGMRSSLAMDWVLADPDTRGPLDSMNYQFGYDGQRRASWVETPEPSGFDQTPTEKQHKDYTYDADATTVNVAGMDSEAGFNRRITKDQAGRMIADTDGTGKTTKYTWNAEDQITSTTDPAGRLSTTTYDDHGNPTHTAGPGPAGCFGDDRLPLDPAPDGCAGVPQTVKAYDEGYTGLSSTWWNNPDSSGAAYGYSTTAPNQNWRTNPPTPGVDPDRFSGRMSGQLQVDTQGDYLFGTAENDVTDGMRVYVDDNLIANRTYAPSVYADKPVGYWRLGDGDGDVRDQSGNGHRGTYSGTVTRQGNGAMPDDNNTAADFAGGKAQIPDSDTLDVTGAMTLEMWVKPRHNEDGGGWNDLLSKYGGTDDAPMPYELSLKPDMTMQLRQSGSGTTWQKVTSDDAVVPGQWNHIAVTRTAGGKVTFYLNGEKAGGGSFAEQGAANAHPLVIGRRENGGNAAAQIDEVAVFDKALAEKTLSAHVAGAGTVNNGRRAITLSPGSHRVRLEYLRHALRGNITRSTDDLNFTWYRIGGNGWKAVPDDKLIPNYGLRTSTTQLESRGVPDKKLITSYGENLDPAYGMDERAVVNPDGLAMGGTATYEMPGEGYLRRTAKTKPTGAQTTYTFYGDTEVRDNPCTDEADPVNQSGLVKTATMPTAADGTTRVEEQVYDVLGRTVADHLTGQGWACTSYDARGRPATKTFPVNSADGERTVTYDYGVDGNPLVSSVSDRYGTITTRVNLLGQTVAYTDANGVETDTEFDALGNTTKETVITPHDGQQVTTRTYDDAGRLLTTELDGTTLATATYDDAGQLASVVYANGTSLAGVDRDGAGRRGGLTWELADGQQVTATVTRSRAGTIVDESLNGVDPRPDGPNYVYDGAGRLTEAYVSGHHYAYDFTSQAADTCPEGTQANAGKNTNRVKLTDTTASGTAVTGYCYDTADRLLATQGALETSYTYDAAGNTTTITDGDSETSLGFDTAGRNLTARTTGPEPASVAYVRDATDRIILRGVDEGDSPGQVLYGYTGDGDGAALTLDGNKRLLTRTLVLPGGVLYTLHATVPAGEADHAGWDYPSVRDDLVLSADDTGSQVGPLRRYGPYGQPLGSDGAVDPDEVPDNQPGDMDYGWLGQNQRPYEHAGSLALVQMGARPYSPLLGRFLSTDPDPAGAANDYDYVGANPINTLDIDGRNWFTDRISDVGSALKSAGEWAWDHRQDIATVGVAVGCTFLTAGGCAFAGGALWAVSLADEYITTGTIDWWKAGTNLALQITSARIAKRLAGGWRERNVQYNAKRPAVKRARGRHRAHVDKKGTAKKWGSNAAQAGVAYTIGQLISYAPDASGRKYYRKGGMAFY
ncbi:LamG-like jellyroll fold domain-containing protein [Saccharomonospora marina]|uniref:LamG-like jellyroll fold domain-containing protein n=1 Tax=Saccharomonospora marina TaxID=632569 RepID=UPI001E2DC740|nr:PA14 domain-containing protein [Saccharomonospora marina]